MRAFGGQPQANNHPGQRNKEGGLASRIAQVGPPGSHYVVSSFRCWPSIAVLLLCTAGVSGWHLCHLCWPLALSSEPPDVL